MGSKVIVFLGLFLAMVFLISSEVAARDLAETSNTIDASSTEATIDGSGGNGGYPGGGGGYGGDGRRVKRCRYGCCGMSHIKGRCKCCSFAGQKADADFQAEPKN